MIDSFAKLANLANLTALTKASLANLTALTKANFVNSLAFAKINLADFAYKKANLAINSALKLLKQLNSPFRARILKRYIYIYQPLDIENSRFQGILFKSKSYFSALLKQISHLNAGFSTLSRKIFTPKSQIYTISKQILFLTSKFYAIKTLLNLLKSKIYTNFIQIFFKNALNFGRNSSIFSFLKISNSVKIPTKRTKNELFKFSQMGFICHRFSRFSRACVKKHFAAST